MVCLVLEKPHMGDPNDTVMDSQWHVDRGSPAPNDPAPNDPQQLAAWKAAQHHNTPSTVHLDSLGRPILSVEYNGGDDFIPTRIELDIEGNAKRVIDARGNTVMTYAYDMLGHRVYQNSMDAGERWMLNNVMGNPVNTWDSRNHMLSFTYDLLQRPTLAKVQGGDGSMPLDNTYSKIVYGEGQANDKQNNLRGQVVATYDTAGKIDISAYDLKDNVLTSTRRFIKDYKNVVDWGKNSPDSQLETESFTEKMQYDALNRVVCLITPDKSQTKPTYNEANFLEKVEVNLRGELEKKGSAEERPKWTSFVTNIDYDAKGQRERIQYANGVNTHYRYDEQTFRLINLKTTRTNDNALLQDLHYTYDPVGNITEIHDNAQQTVFFNNAVVTPSSQYTYDALYRLVKASGREHAGGVSDKQRDHEEIPSMPLPHANNTQAMRSYTELYKYDQVGNILRLNHQANGGTWNRYYQYATDSNRLLNTSLPTDSESGPFSAVYSYDDHGNMTTMPHLSEMDWDFQDQLQRVDLGGGGIAYYIYDAGGQRVRKVHEKNGGGHIEERLYLGGYEVFRKRNAGGQQLERETLHVMDDHQRIVLVETKIIDTESPVIGPPTPVIRYQLSNHLGSASLELD